MTTVTILAGHPYFKFARPAVWHQPWNGMWTVRWRDFLTMKQDAEFDTQERAEAFAATICKPPITLDDEDGWNIAEADEFWRSI